MSSSSKYSGLAGTVLLGTLLGLNYTQYSRRKSPLADKAASFNPDEENSSGSFFDKDGNPIPLGKTNLPGSDFMKALRDYMPDASPLFLCAALSGLWAIRAFGAMNKVLNRRYADVVYQIRRPDIISNTLIAWKYLGLGSLAVPVMFGGLALVAKENSSILEPKQRALEETMVNVAGASKTIGSFSPLRIERGALSSSISEFSKTLREGFRA